MIIGAVLDLALPLATLLPHSAGPYIALMLIGFGIGILGHLSGARWLVAAGIVLIFLGAFLGTTVACALLTLYAFVHWEVSGTFFLLLGSLLYLVGNFGVTLFCNVPRNNALAKLDAGNPDSSVPWRTYLDEWTRWNHVRTGTALAASAMLMIGLFLMVTRKKAISQVLALLTVENAIFLVALGITSGMPLVVELGIFFDVILAVLVLGVLVRRIVDRFESMDVSRLSKLKG